MKLLFVNACVREEKSRTLELCRDYLSKFVNNHPEWQIEEVNLEKENIKPLDKGMLEKRDLLRGSGTFEDSMFNRAKQLISADQILVGAPYWDLQFPALLKIYLEQCSVTGLTFIYDEKGVPHGQCRAQSLVYLTTSGSPIGKMNFGYDYIHGLCMLFGINKTYFASAEGLDIIGNDVNQIMKNAKKKISEIVKEV